MASSDYLSARVRTATLVGLRVTALFHANVERTAVINVRFDVHVRNSFLSAAGVGGRVLRNGQAPKRHARPLAEPSRS